MFIIGISNTCSSKIFSPFFYREMSGVLIMMTWIGISRFTNIGRFVFKSNIENCRFIYMILIIVSE
jgi:hypothetical protein